MLFYINKWNPRHFNNKTILCVQYVSSTEKNVFMYAHFLNYIETDSLSGMDIAFFILNGMYPIPCYKIVYYWYFIIDTP